MAQSKWICKNVDGCDKAFNNDGKAFDDLLGHEVESQFQPYTCEDCGKPLLEIKTGGGSGGGIPKFVFIILGVLLLGGGGLALYFVFGGKSEPPKITITPKNPTVQVGENISLTATVEPEKARTKLNLNWTSGDESIATVNDRGSVAGVAEGSVTITVKDEKEKVSESVTVTVFPNEPTVQSIKLIPERLSLQVNASGELTAEISPENADRSSLRWESNNLSVATVNAGNVNAVAEGVAVITVTDTKGGVKAEATVTVTERTFPCGTYSGERSANGQPHGLGTFTYHSRTLIDDLKMVYAEQGDYVTGTFREGKIVSVQLYGSGGNLKQTVIPQQPASICR